MKTNEKLIGMLNDLIRINNDRYEGYTSLLTKNVLLDKDVWMIVCNLANQSRANASNLIAEAIRLRTVNATGSSLSAGIYYPSIGLKDALAIGDRETILESCRHKEDLIQKAYYDAISLGIEMPERIIAVLVDQKREMKITSGLFKARQRQLTEHAVAA